MTNQELQLLLLPLLKLLENGEVDTVIEIIKKVIKED